MSDDLHNPLIRTYSFSINEKFLTKKFTNDEKKILRPIAETLALLDMNAFFSFTLNDGREYYEQYLVEAATLFYDSGGFNGWAGMASWVKEQIHENDAVKDAYINWQTIKKLSQTE